MRVKGVGGAVRERRDLYLVRHYSELPAFVHSLGPF